MAVEALYRQFPCGISSVSTSPSTANSIRSSVSLRMPWHDRQDAAATARTVQELLVVEDSEKLGWREDQDGLEGFQTLQLPVA